MISNIQYIQKLDKNQEIMKDSSAETEACFRSGGS
jgi:hypothetical protein